MFILGNVLMGLGVVLQNLLWVYSIVLFARAVVSWVSADPRNPIVHFLHSATDPLLRIVRRMLPTNLRYFPIDIAFLVLLAIVLFSQYAIAQTLIDIGLRLRRPVVMEPV
jgi:YggT family protein